MFSRPGILPILNLLEPSPLRQHLIACTLLRTNIRPAQPLLLLSSPHAVVLQPPIYHLATNPIRRTHIRLLTFQMHGALRSASNSFPANKIPAIGHHAIVAGDRPYHASHDQAAAEKQYHAQHGVHELVGLAALEKRPALLLYAGAARLAVTVGCCIL